MQENQTFAFFLLKIHFQKGKSRELREKNVTPRNQSIQVAPLSSKKISQSDAFLLQVWVKRHFYNFAKKQWKPYEREKLELSLKSMKF